MTLSSAPDPEAIEKKVAGSSFYSAMRLMPKAERDAMFAIYAFCRAVDDIADDGEGTRPERAERLTEWRRDLDALYKGGAPVLSAFLAPPTGVLPWRGWNVEGELVWGATAAIVRSFVAIVREVVPDLGP